jgi:hypothetical protein
MLRVWGGMLPNEATESFVNFMTFTSLPGEIKCSADGKLVKAPRGVLLRRFVPCWLFHTLLLYLLNYLHQIAQAVLPRKFDGILDPISIPYAAVDVMSLYIAAAYGSLLGCVVCAFFGYDPETPFHLPWHAVEEHFCKNVVKNNRTKTSKSNQNRKLFFKNGKIAKICKKKVTFREMWGKRWNRSVQLHLNRIFFVPLKNRG